MATAAAFLAAIRAEPDDDTHRLVYADWLEENDHPRRAALIRVQVALSQAQDATTRAALEQQQADLVADPQAVLGYGPLTSLTFEFRRGFIARVFGHHLHLLWGRHQHPLSDFLAVAPRLAADLVEASVEFRFEDAGRMGMFADGQPGELPLDLLAEFLAAPILLQCAELHLTHALLSDAAAGLLRDASGCPRLTCLGLTGCEPSAGALALLLAAPWIENLRWLALDSGCFEISGPYDGYANRALTEAEVALLANCPALGNLEELDLVDRGVTVAGAEALLTSVHLRKLRQLRLSRSTLGEAGANQLRARFGERLLV